jgi:hypothetical protein
MRPAILAALVVLLTATTACGSADHDTGTQPTPDATIFVQGGVGNIPVFGRSEVLQPESHENGVMTVTYGARNTTPAAVARYYQSALEGRGWTTVEPPTKVGTNAYRARFRKAGQQLEVSASAAPDTGSDRYTVQYSLILRSG